MDPLLSQFIHSQYEVDPSATVPLKSAVLAFRESLEPAARRDWPRSRFVAEIAKQFQLAQDFRRIFHIVGLAPTQPVRVERGKLVPV